MAHLIDKDALVAWAKETYLCENASMIRKVCYKQLLEHLDTLEVKEVDLEKTLIGFQNRYAYENGGEYPSAIDIAKYFFELGIKSKSSYVGIPNIDDTLEEMGVDPDSKSAKIFKEFYYMALEKFKAQKGEKV